MLQLNDEKQLLNKSNAKDKGVKYSMIIYMSSRGIIIYILLITGKQLVSANFLALIRS